MNTKTIEIRDRATFIPAMAIRLGSDIEADRYLLARSGFGRSRAEQSEYVLLIRLGDVGKCACDPYEWGDRTMMVAHDHLLKNFDDIEPGAVVDVEFILGEKAEPSASERATT